MPKVQKYVQIKNGGEWLHALVTEEFDENNLRLEFWIGSDRQDVSSKKGTADGEWRDPS